MAGKKPLEKFSKPPQGITPKLNTTKPGRFRFSVPSPYEAHEPKLGRPALFEPVCKCSTPVECSGNSAFIERITAMSSTQVAICGNNSLTGVPDCPCC